MAFMMRLNFKDFYVRLLSITGLEDHYEKVEVRIEIEIGPGDARDA